MDVDNLLEKWCKKKGLDPEKIPQNIWDTVVSRTEGDIEEFLESENEDKHFIDEWAWMEIEQNLEEHPEWKLK